MNWVSNNRLECLCFHCMDYVLKHVLIECLHALKECVCEYVHCHIMECVHNGDRECIRNRDMEYKRNRSMESVHNLDLDLYIIVT